MPRLVEGITPRKGLMAPQNNFLDKIAKRFKGTHANFVLGNAAIGPDFPIVYCSDGFCELTGQNRAAVMRQPVHCPFLYGQATDTRHRAEVETALRESKELKLSIQLYADPGIPFWCLLDIIPIRNEFGKVVLFLLSFKNITETYSASRNPSTYSLDSRLEFEPLDSEDTKKSFSRRRSRAVLSELSGCYIYQEPKQTGRREGRRHFSRFLSSSSAPIYKTARMQERCGIISHYGSFRKCWDFVILVAIMYVALIVPYNAAFNRDPDGECSRTNLKPSIACDILVEMIFILDIFFNFRMSFINKKGEVVYKLKDIAINYITGWFLLDLFAALPFDLLYATCLIDNMDNFTSVDILKLTRLVRLARFIQKMDRLSQYSAVILTMLMIFFGFIAHWLACIWFVIGVNHTEEHPTGWMKQLAAENDLENITMVPKMDSYITALYFTCTSLTTVGFGNVAGNTRIEKLFCIFVMFVGALMHATIFGNVASIVGRIYVRRQEYDRKMLDLDHFAKIHKIPKDIRHRMEDHLQTKWFFNNGINYEISAEYPNCLRGEICAHIHKEVLELPLFETLPSSALKNLGQIIETQFAGPNEFLINKDDILSSVWYISSGSLEVLDKGMVVAILGHGDMFGSDLDHLLNENKITIQCGFDVKALTYCELKCIDTEGMVSCVNMLSDSSILTDVAEDLKNDLTYNLKGLNRLLGSRTSSVSVPTQHAETQTECRDLWLGRMNFSTMNSAKSLPKLETTKLIDEPLYTSCALYPRYPLSPSTHHRVKFDLDPRRNSSSGVIPDKYPKKAILRNLSMARSYSLDPEGSGSIIELPSPRYSSLQEADGLGNKSEHPSYLVNHLEQRISKPEPIETTRKPKELTKLQRFQAKFSKRNVSLEDDARREENPKDEIRPFNIPEIRLEIPDDDLEDVLEDDHEMEESEQDEKNGNEEKEKENEPGVRMEELSSRSKIVDRNGASKPLTRTSHLTLDLIPADLKDEVTVRYIDEDEGEKHEDYLEEEGESHSLIQSNYLVPPSRDLS